MKITASEQDILAACIKLHDESLYGHVTAVCTGDDGTTAVVIDAQLVTSSPVDVDLVEGAIREHMGVTVVLWPTPELKRQWLHLPA